MRTADDVEIVYFSVPYWYVNGEDKMMSSTVDINSPEGVPSQTHIYVQGTGPVPVKDIFSSPRALLLAWIARMDDSISETSKLLTGQQKRKIYFAAQLGALQREAMSA